MINLTINVDFYDTPDALLRLWPSQVEMFLVVTYNQSEANRVFLDLYSRLKDIKGANVLQGARIIESPIGNVKVCTADQIPDSVRGLYNVGVLVTEDAYEHLTIRQLAYLNQMSASFFDAAPRRVHAVNGR